MELSYGYFELMGRVTASGLEVANPGNAVPDAQADGRGRRGEEHLGDARGRAPARRVYSITDVGEAYPGFWALE